MKTNVRMVVSVEEANLTVDYDPAGFGTTEGMSSKNVMVISKRGYTLLSLTESEAKRLRVLIKRALMKGGVE